MAEVFRQKTIRLAVALEQETEHDAARQALGGFLDKIIHPSHDNGKSTEHDPKNR